MQNMIRKFTAGLLAVLLTACANDLGNYDYRDLDEPVITGIGTPLAVLTHTRLRLSPDLGGDFPESRYAFEWRALSESAGTVETLAETRDLDYVVTLAAGAYTLLFKVTERSSGVYWQQSCALQVSDTTSEGWMVLCAEGADDRVRLDMVSAVTGETYTDVLRDNGMPVLTGPRRIQWSRFADSESPYYLLTDDGATRLGRNGFEWKEEYRLVYEMGTSADPCPETIVDATKAKMLVGGGEAFFAECVVAPGLFGPVGESLNAAPAVGCNITTQAIVVPMALLYDLDGKRFMGYSPTMRSAMGSRESLYEMNELVDLLGAMDEGGSVVGNAFDRFPRGMDFVWMENTRYDPNGTNMGVVYTVLREGDRFCLYGTQLGELWGKVTVGDCAYALGKAAYGDLSACTEIARATQFAFSSLKSCLYYAAGDTVYRVDLAASPLVAERQFTLPGETITCMKFNIFQQSANLRRSFDLVVASVRDGAGTLRIYEGFDSDGDFSAVEPEIHTGLGRIVDVAYREMLR